jgi:tRNA pseudouridine55 synthase
MDGLLIVDKPSGPTSHDVVARMRRVLREKRIGHTGTLDPLASGVLPLVVGRATRLARFLSGDKVYDAVVRLGIETDTYDVLGSPVGDASSGPWPSPEQVEAALAPFRGTFLQQPPAYSAKKVAGRRSYALARASKRKGDAAGTTASTDAVDPTLPALVSVTAHAVDLIEAGADFVRLRVRCAAGFYVRSLAHDLGAALGTGGHLVDLRRIEAAGFSVADAVPLARLQDEDGAGLAERSLISMERMLDGLPWVALTENGVIHARRGQNLGPTDASDGFMAAVLAAGAPTPRPVRLLDPGHHLVAMAEAADAPGLLHPSVVLM